MDKIEKMKQEKKYEQYVKQKTPTPGLLKNMLKAFVTGGLICTLGQIIFNLCKLQGL